MELRVVKLGFVVEVVPVRLITVVAALAVIEVLLIAIWGVPVVTGVKVRVTPAGTPLNVNRMSVPFGSGTLLLEAIVAVRHPDAIPSFITIDPVASGTWRFVKIVAVPSEPMAKLPMPGPKLLITVRGPGVDKT